MKREELWEAIGNADEKYLAESEKRTLPARWRVTAAMAACLALVLATVRIFNVDVMLGAVSVRNGSGEFADCTREYEEWLEDFGGNFDILYYMAFSSKQEFYEFIADDEFTEEERRRLAEEIGGRNGGKIGLPQRERMLGITFAGTEDIYAVLWEGWDRYLYFQKCEYNGKEFEIRVKPARSYSEVADFLAKKYSLWKTKYNDRFWEFYHGGVGYYIYQIEGRNPEMLVVSGEGYQFVSLRIPGGEKLTLEFIKQFKPYSCDIKK